MAYIFVSAGWNANHSVVQFFQDDSENAPREAFYQENNKPRMILLDRKGAGAIDAFDDEISPNVSIDSDYSRLHAVPGANQQTFDEEKDGEKRNFTERTDEELVETQIENWDGGVEVHRSQSMKSGWSSKWNKNWTQFRYPSLVTLPELHNASPPELTSYVAGYERVGESKYLEQVEDAVRVMAEESDRVEGFIYLADCFDGFAGGVDRVIEMNQDDYHRRSLLFSFDEPEPKATPFSLVSKSLALQSQADLIIPLWSPQSTSTDEQCTTLSSVISNVMYLLEGIHISAVQHRLSPFSRQKIVQTMSLKTNQPISQMLQKKPEEIERNLHWMDWKAIAPPSYKPKKSFQPRSIVNVCLGQVSRSQYRDSIDNDLCCWYNRHLRCAAQSVLMPSSSQSIEEGASLISLRTTNAIHEYLACLLQRVKKFPYKLSGFEDDDWAEKVENLSALRDQTSPTDDFSSDSD